MKAIVILAIIAFVQIAYALPTSNAPAKVQDKDNDASVPAHVAKAMDAIKSMFQNRGKSDGSTDNEITATVGSAVVAVNGNVYYEIDDFEYPKDMKMF